MAVVTDDPRSDLYRMKILASGDVVNIHLFAGMGPHPAQSTLAAIAARRTHRFSLRVLALAETRDSRSSTDCVACTIRGDVESSVTSRSTGWGPCHYNRSASAIKAACAMIASCHG
jgi:hypothetical protein